MPPIPRTFSCSKRCSASPP